MRSVATERIANWCLVRRGLVAAAILVTAIFASLVAALWEHAYLILAAAFGLIVAVATLVVPVLGVYAVIAIMFAENLLRLGGISASRLLVPLTLGAWLIHGLARKQFKLALPLQGWLALAFATWGGISALWSMDVGRIPAVLQTMIQSIGLYILVVHLVDSFKRLRSVVAIMLLATMVLSAIGLGRAVTREAVNRVDVIDILGTGPHFLGGYLVPGAAMLMAWLGHEVKPGRKVVLLCVWLAAVLAILATGTRAASVALVVIATVGMAIERRLRLLLMLALVLGSLGTALLLPSASLERLESILTVSDRGAGRLDIWLVALQIIRHHPVLGVGLDAFGLAFDTYLNNTPGLGGNYFVRGWGSHNVFLRVQAELGVVGSALFVAIVGLSVKHSWEALQNLKRTNNDNLQTLGLGLWLGLLGMLTVCLFLDWQYTKYLWLLFALAEATWRLSTQTIAGDNA